MVAAMDGKTSLLARYAKLPKLFETPALLTGRIMLKQLP